MRPVSEGTRKRYGNMGITEFSGKLKASFCEHRKPEDNLFNENGLHKLAMPLCDSTTSHDGVVQSLR